MENYEEYLKNNNLSQKTIEAYVFTKNKYFSLYNSITKSGLLAFKGYLIENYKAKTINQRIQGINKYLEFIGKGNLRIKSVKEQDKNFLENVISDADYRFFKNQLKRDKIWQWYFVVRYLTTTGARIGELVQLKVEHIMKGYFDIYAKGGKIRRLYIPKKLREETIIWLRENKISSGYLFINKYGKKITPRGIAMQLKTLAIKYGISPSVVYPHSFRHRFAKNFLEKYNDIALLADLMGHESIETTRIYLGKTSTEQRELVDKIVTW